MFFENLINKNGKNLEVINFIENLKDNNNISYAICSLSNKALDKSFNFLNSEDFIINNNYKHIKANFGSDIYNVEKNVGEKIKDIEYIIDIEETGKEPIIGFILKKNLELNCFDVLYDVRFYEKNICYV